MVRTCTNCEHVLIAYVPLIWHGPHRERCLQQFFVAGGISLPNCYLATVRGYTDTFIDSLLIRHGPHRKSRVQQFFCCWVYAFFTVGTCLPSSCLAMIAGIHIQTHRPMRETFEVRSWDGLRCHDIYINFHNDRLRYSKVDLVWNSQTQRQHYAHKPIFTFSLLCSPGSLYSVSIKSLRGFEKLWCAHKLS
jgi:hypothetical protein